MARPDEFDLIARYFAPLAAGFPGALALGDDAAILESIPGEEMVVTTDALVAGIHFPADELPDAIARKALRVNLSDLAAMGARPIAYTLAAVLPRETGEAWLADFAAGLKDDQEIFGIALAGGDTVATDGPLTLSVTAFGAVSAGRAVLRGGARPGDRILVSGTIGDAALGLRVFRGDLDIDDPARGFLLSRYRLPIPRTGLGSRIAGWVHAMIDISDGLLADLGHVCDRSAVGASVRAEDLPLSDAARTALSADGTLISRILNGGDDYELLAAAPADTVDEILAAADEVGVPVTDIGEITETSGVRVFGSGGSILDTGEGGFRHF